jgi:lipopolysaccharide export system protein LptA
MTSRSLPRLVLTLAATFVIGHSSFVIPARAQPATAVPTELTSDHLEMTSTDDETTAVATKNVVLTGTNLRITCDRLTIIASRIGDKDATIGTVERFKYILATGNVRIVQGDRESTSQKAEVFPREDKVVLSEEPVVIDHSNGFVGAGEKITLFRGKREVQVEKPKFTGPPVDDLSATASAKPGAQAPKPAAAPAPQTKPGVTFPKPATTTR